MRKSFFVAAAVAALVFSTRARADPIQIYCTCISGSAGTTLTPLTGGMLGISAGVAYGPNATFQGDDNSASFTWPDMIAGSDGGVVGAGSLTYNPGVIGSGDSDTLQGSIAWNEAAYNASGGFFNLIGTGTVTASSGDAAFETSFSVGTIFAINALFLTPCAVSPGCAFDQPQPAGFYEATVTAAAPSPSIGGESSAPFLISIALIVFVGRFRRRVKTPPKFR